MDLVRELDVCIFCGGTDTTEEHVIADWVQRAFERKRRSGPSFGGTFVARDQMRVGVDAPVATAKVVCRSCNNEWLSGIDNAAAGVLKPLIRGKEAVKLDPAAQTVFAAWLFKTALTFDAMENGDLGRLAAPRKAFFETREAPPGLMIFAGPAPEVPFSVPDVPEVAGLRLFGMRPLDGVLNLTINAASPDGTMIEGVPTTIPIPGYQVMLGGLFAYMCSRIPFFDLSEDFVQIWPVVTDEVEVKVKPMNGG